MKTVITNLQYLANQGVILSYEINGKERAIRFSETSLIWDYLDEDTFEGGKAYLWGKYIGFSALVASGQGGVFFVWDTETEKFVHYSEGSYFVDAVLSNGDIIILREISNFVTPYHLEVFVVPFGTMNVEFGGQRVFCVEPSEYHSSSLDGIRLKLTGNRLEIEDEDTTHLYSENVMKLREQRPNELFADLYKDYGHGLDPRKLAFKSMIT